MPALVKLLNIHKELIKKLIYIHVHVHAYTFVYVHVCIILVYAYICVHASLVKFIHTFAYDVYI